MKDLLFLFLFSSISVYTFAQKAHDYPQKNGFQRFHMKQKLPRVQKGGQKSMADTLYFEDFNSSGSLPPGWVSTDFTGNNFHWIWSNSAPGGQYSSGVSALQSTSSSNGFLLFPSDLYNTPFPPGGPSLMNAQVTSPGIPISPSPSIKLQFEQYYRFCCSGNQYELRVEVSADSINWTSFDITNGMANSNSNPNPELMNIDVSSILAFKNTAFIRFRQSNASHYFFMVDDLLLSGGLQNSTEIDSVHIDFVDSKIYSPMYTRMSSGNAPKIDAHLRIWNGGSNIQTGIQAQLDFIHDSTASGASGLGLVHSVVDSSITSLISFQKSSLNLYDSNFTVPNCGSYSIKLQTSSDSIGQNPGASQYTYPLFVGDTVNARDRDTFALGVSPASYPGGGNNRDCMGLLYTLSPNTKYVNGALATSISFFVKSAAHSVGSVISPRIWPFDETKSTLDSAIGNPVARSSIATTIDMSMHGKWLTLPLIPPAVLTPGEAYIVGWVKLRGGYAKSFVVGRDLSMEPLMGPVNTFVYINDIAVTGWGWVPVLPGIRLNIAGNYPSPCLPVTLPENEKGSVYSLFPNPTTGQFRLQLENAASANYQLKVRNALGQVVLEKPISGTALKNYEVDLTGQEKGLYFLSLESDKERWVEKLLLQ